jgi:hypothetical protein
MTSFNKDYILHDKKLGSSFLITLNFEITKIKFLNESLVLSPNEENLLKERLLKEMETEMLSLRCL